MTDEEVICAWMQKRPADGYGAKVDTPESLWWVYRYEVRDMRFHWWWYPPILTFDHMHEVQARLTEQQWDWYLAEFWQVVEGVDGPHPKSMWVRAALHATVEQKKKALAETIRATTGAKQ